MQIMSIGSGSSGNCFYLETGGSRLLIDLGLNTKTIVNALSSIGITPADIDGVFITHTHSDHTSAIPVMRKRLHCPYYMSELSNARLFLPGTVVVTPGRPFRISDTVTVTAAETSHDCPGSLCYRFDTDTESIGYATDLGHVSEEIKDMLRGCSALVLECNHDVQMLRDGPYPFILKRRILSDAGHLSNDACASAAAEFASSGTKSIYLAHLSRENNTPSKAYSAVSQALDLNRVNLTVLNPFGNSPETL